MKWLLKARLVLSKSKDAPKIPNWFYKVLLTHDYSEDFGGKKV